MKLPSSRLILVAALAVAVLPACSKNGAATTAPAASATPPPAKAPTAPATYAINISPAWTVGQVFGYVGDDVTDSPDGKVSVHLEADGEVMALMPNGNPQKIAYTVKVLRVTGGDIPQAGFPATGAKIVAEDAANNKQVVTFDGKPADSDVADALGAVLWLTAPNHTDQEVYGPTAPVALAATWPINAAAFMDYKLEGQPQTTSIDGLLTLDRIEGDGDQRMSVISGDFKTAGKSPPDAPGTYTGTYHFTVSAPLNHQGVYREVMATTTHVTPTDPTEKPATIQETTTQEVTVK